MPVESILKIYETVFLIEDFTLSVFFKANKEYRRSQTCTTNAKYLIVLLPFVFGKAIYLSFNIERDMPKLTPWTISNEQSHIASSQSLNSTVDVVLAADLRERFPVALAPSYLPGGTDGR